MGLVFDEDALDTEAKEEDTKEGMVKTTVETGTWGGGRASISRSEFGNVAKVAELGGVVEVDTEQGGGDLGTRMGEEPPRAMVLKGGGFKSSDGIRLVRGRLRDCEFFSSFPERQGSHLQDGGCDLDLLLFKEEHFLCWDKEQEGHTSDFSSSRIGFLQHIHVLLSRICEFIESTFDFLASDSLSRVFLRTLL